MICPKCGREIPDGTLCPCAYEAPALSSNPAVNAIKTSGSSKLVLTAVILLTLSRLVSMILSFAGVLGGTVQVNFEGSGMMNPELANSAINVSRALGLVVLIIGFVPAVLRMLGMWVHYATCRNRFNGNISTAGLTLCKVSAIIVIAFAGLFCLMLLFYMIVIFAFSGSLVDVFSSMMEYGGSDIYPEMMSGLMIGAGFAAVLVLAVVALMICYYASMIRLLNRMKVSANSGIPDVRISRFLMGMMYVSAVLSALVGLGSLFSSPIAGLCSIGSAVALILLAVALGRLRQQMMILMYPPVQPVYAPQPVMPMQGYPVQQGVQPPFAPAPVETPTPMETPTPVETPAPVETSTPVETPAPEEKPEE